MALLGGLSGLAGEMKLTRERIENLADVQGLLKFQVTGDDGFELLTHFGSDPIPKEPATSISIRTPMPSRLLALPTVSISR